MIRFLPENLSWQAELWNPYSSSVRPRGIEPAQLWYWEVFDNNLQITVAIGTDHRELQSWLEKSHHRNTRYEVENIYGEKFDSLAWERTEDLIQEDCDGMDAGYWIRVIETFESARQSQPAVEDNIEDMLPQLLRLMAAIEVRHTLNPDADRGARERMRGVVREIFTDVLALEKEKPV